MRIAHVAPLMESVPPAGYGGTERVVSYLAEEQVRRGHDVTVYASGDSCTSGRLIPCCPAALRTGMRCADPAPYQAVQLERVLRDADRYDIVHFHTSPLHCPAVRGLRTPHVTTEHGRMDLPGLEELHGLCRGVPLVSISDAQRRPLPRACWVGTVHHGLPRDLYTFDPRGGEGFAFVGRVSPEKRVDRAIEIAVAAGVPLRIAAKVDRADQEYFNERIRPLLDHPLVEFLGEASHAGKQALLGGSRALLFPIDWPEPFGLVMIEAMACGTPVIAWRNGSVPEVMADGVTGRVVDSMEGAIEAAATIGSSDRVGVRRAFEERFTSERMAEGYERIYLRLLRGEAAPDPESGAAAQEVANA